MSPKWHILFGAIFTIILWLSIPELNWFFLVLIFFSSFLIDLDHYIASGIKTGKWSLKNSLEYHKKLIAKEKEDLKKGIKRKFDFHFFHTLEFHFLIGLASILWTGFFYIFVGMVFHSLLDVADLVYRGALSRREFFFFNWLAKKI